MKSDLVLAAGFALGCLAPATARRWQHGDYLHGLDHFVTYGATFFEGPNCTGDIGTGPIVNFGCSDHCFQANGALSVMLEGEYYDFYASNGGDRDDGNYCEEKFEQRYSRIHRDGPVAYPYSTGDCDDRYELGRVAIHSRHNLVCATFDRPAYGFKLHFQRMCTPEDRLRKAGRPSPPSTEKKVTDWTKEPQSSGFQAWTGDEPGPDEPPSDGDEDGDECRTPGCGPRIRKGHKGDWAKTREGWQAWSQEDFNRMPFNWDEEREVLGSGQTLRAWSQEAEAAFHSWRGDDDENRRKNRKPKSGVYVHGKPKDRPVDDELKPGERPGVIWGDTAREQVGYWAEGSGSAP